MLFKKYIINKNNNNQINIFIPIGFILMILGMKLRQLNRWGSHCSTCGRKASALTFNEGHSFTIETVLLIHIFWGTEQYFLTDTWITLVGCDGLALVCRMLFATLVSGELPQTLRKCCVNTRQ